MIISKKSIWQWKVNYLKKKCKKQTIFLFGPQGVGKTTICKLLSSKLNMKIIESDEQEFESYDVGDDSNWSDVWNQRKELFAH